MLLRGWGMEVADAAGVADARAAARAGRRPTSCSPTTGWSEETGVQVIEALWRDLGAPVPALIVSAEEAAAIRRLAEPLGVPVLEKPVAEGTAAPRAPGAARGDGVRCRPGLRARLMLGALVLAVLAVAAAGLAVYGLARTQALAAEALAAQRRIEAYGALASRMNEWMLAGSRPPGLRPTRRRSGGGGGAGAAGGRGRGGRPHAPAPGPGGHDELGLLLARVRRVAARVARDPARLSATVAERTAAPHLGQRPSRSATCGASSPTGRSAGSCSASGAGGASSSSRRTRNDPEASSPLAARPAAAGRGRGAQRPLDGAAPLRRGTGRDARSPMPRSGPFPARVR